MLKPLTFLSPELAVLIYCLAVVATIIIASLVVAVSCNIPVDGKPAARSNRSRYKKERRTPGYSITVNTKKDIREVS